MHKKATSWRRATILKMKNSSCFLVSFLVILNGKFSDLMTADESAGKMSSESKYDGMWIVNVVKCSSFNDSVPIPVFKCMLRYLIQAVMKWIREALIWQYRPKICKKIKFLAPLPVTVWNLYINPCCNPQRPLVQLNR